MSCLRLSPLPFGWACLLLWCLPLSAQDPVPCVRPLHFTPPAGPPIGEAPHHREGPAVFLSSGGRLCQALEGPDPDGVPVQSIQERDRAAGRAFLLSVALPGFGQKSLGQNRWVAYVAVEGWAWIQFMERRREGRRLQDRYRDLAWLVARRVSSGRRVDGNFEYYEAMTEYQASGAFDIDPALVGIQPEEDPRTFNGSIWALAREIFLPDNPEEPAGVGSDHYQSALRYYLSRAYAPELAWNWSNNTLQQAEFARLIRSSDENLRRGTTMVGIILANHLLSAVDALVTGRLLQEGEERPLVELSLLPGPFSQDALTLSIRIPTR